MSNRCLIEIGQFGRIGFSCGRDGHCVVQRIDGQRRGRGKRLEGVLKRSRPNDMSREYIPFWILHVSEHVVLRSKLPCVQQIIVQMLMLDNKNFGGREASERERGKSGPIGTTKRD